MLNDFRRIPRKDAKKGKERKDGFLLFISASSRGPRPGDSREERFLGMLNDFRRIPRKDAKKGKERKDGFLLFISASSRGPTRGLKRRKVFRDVE